MNNILEVRSLEAAYGQSVILWGIDLDVPRGGVTTVMGRNGVGKTTLMRSIMGLVDTRHGIITFNGEQLTDLPTHKRAAKGIGYVPQGREIIPKLTVYENIAIGTHARRDARADFDEQEIYALFPILRTFRDRLGGNLSGGQQQQLAIARALVGGPDLLILDEPTEGIQPSIVDEIADVLRRLVDEKGLTVLLVEQKLDFARKLTDNYAVIDRGRVVQNASRDTVDYDKLKELLSV